MKKIITLISLGLIGLVGIKPPLIAQSLVTQSIGSSGFVSTQIGQDHINWHVGEVIIGHAAGQWNANQGVYQYIDLSNYNNRPDFNSDLFAAFPSPTNGHVNIHSTTTITMDIISASGVIIDKVVIDQNESHTDISHLPDGSYYFVGHSNDQSTKAIKIVLIK